MSFLLCLTGVGVSCRISYSIASYSCVCCSGSITSVGGRLGELIFLLLFTCNYVISYLVQIIFYFWSFEIKECILRVRK